jgi:hypothetical protein
MNKDDIELFKKIKSNNSTNANRKIKNSLLEDIKYFKDQLEQRKKRNDTAGIKIYTKRLALTEDAVLIYKLNRKPDRMIVKV